MFTCHLWQVLFWLPIIGTGSLALAASGPGAVSAEQEKWVRSFLDQHCVECHGPKKAKKDLRLDQIKMDFADKAVREQWRDVLEQIETGEMPPEKQPQPPAQEVRALSEWIIASIAAADRARRATEGRVVLRRLNRTEYENTVRDLLGVDANLEDMLPLDTSSDGFDNIGDALHTSSFLMDRYLEAADFALGQAIANRPQPKSVLTRYLLTESHQVKSTSERVFRKSEDGRVVAFSSSPWQAMTVSKFYPSERGQYRFRISASAMQIAGKPVVFRVWSGSGGMGGAKGHLAGYFDAPPDKAAVIEFVDHMEPKTTISILPYALASAQTVHKLGAENYDGPGLAIDWVEVEGPINETWPPASHRRIFGELRQVPAPIYNQRDRVEVASDNPSADAKHILENFARRAFRRPVTDAELKPILALVEARLAQKHSFEKAVRVGLLAIMTSPEFIFLREAPGKLDDFALASRLSYFLWSTMPDDELFALAGQRKLSQAAVLYAQVERLLSHSKAAAFTENFTGQWLGLRDIDFTVPSHIQYPEFDDMLKVSMLREAELFFAEILKNDLSITNFVASDFSMLNGRLAKHYGIPGVEGWEFRKVTLPPDSHRGGVLTMAGVLKVTANGTSTSPVMRGAWVLDRILGTPPPKPPEAAAQLEPDTRGATTIRERLAKHRSIETCASCHVKIDPPGFALESFDVIGGWREFYRTSGNGKPVTIDGRKMPYLHGPKVDPADVLHDGRAFRDSDELKQLLLTSKDQIARSLTSKLVTYATGGAPEISDQPEIRAIVGKVSAKNYGFRSLIHEIVASTIFQNK
jgi:hypothetical protein